MKCLTINEWLLFCYQQPSIGFRCCPHLLSLLGNIFFSPTACLLPVCVVCLYFFSLFFILSSQSLRLSWYIFAFHKFNLNKNIIIIVFINFRLLIAQDLLFAYMMKSFHFNGCLIIFISNYFWRKTEFFLFEIDFSTFLTSLWIVGKNWCKLKANMNLILYTNVSTFLIDFFWKYLRFRLYLTINKNFLINIIWNF